MFPLGQWRVLFFELLGREQYACLRKCLYPQRSRRFCLVKHYYEASFFTSRFVRRTRDFGIGKHKLLWADCTFRRLDCSNWPLISHSMAARGYERLPETSEHTQPKLWHDEGKNGLSGTGINRPQGSAELWMTFHLQLAEWRTHHELGLRARL